MSKQYLVVVNGNFDQAQVYNTRKECHEYITELSKTTQGYAEIYKQASPSLLKKFVFESNQATEVKSA